MAVIKKHSVAPIYTIAVVWVVYTLVHSLCQVSDYVSVILLSAVAFIVAKGIWPTVTYEIPDPVEPPKEEEAQAEAAQEPEQDPKITALIQEKDKAIGEMRRLNDAISDETISKQIDQLEEATAKIVGYVAEHPEKLPQIRKFMNYYLPTTLKLLNAYDRMGTAGVSGENIDGTMGKIETMMETVVSAFHKQLDALFQDEAMDIASDITVMENLMAQEGLTD
jgi:5-bromo-4-chloroindolyl phosphate hydrolysis protein